ncbi:ataxin-2-like protein isoform X4 [Acanthopagrus latus]|uniref:ataxin-2-like protein isoform X4 n=1 Tax=Acanthopagrus latus TaxID=8177 RepID=UPI00187C8ECA|nr:ataxin-2-like protein isoform X4 [Acanthopagrus latus]
MAVAFVLVSRLSPAAVEALRVCDTTAPPAGVDTYHVGRCGRVLSNRAHLLPCFVVFQRRTVFGLSNRVTSHWSDETGITGMHMTKKTRNTMKPPSQTQSSPLNSLMFEGVYNNARMLHFLTAVVGSTCDVRVKNGAVYEGIFKTLSSQCELAVDAVHKQSDGDGGGGGGGGEEGGGRSPSLPRIEDITDTMIFSPTDLVTMTCRDVDLSFAVRDTFTDTAISSVRVNGEHREKVLQRWDGHGNGENFELEADTSNGWDANEMFKFNEEAYGVKSTYDSSLSMYTMPLEKGNSEVFRQREARAARLANEIESSLQYRRRVSLENDEGRSEEDKFSSVVREREERSSPGFSSSSREGKYIPLPQRARDIGLSGSSMRAGGSGRTSAASSSRHPPPSSSSPKPPSDRSSPLSVRTAYSPHQSQSSPPAANSPPCTNHIPHSLSHPQALADTTRSSVNGVSSRTSPKSQRLQSNRNLRTPNSQSSPAVSRGPKPDAPPQDLPLVGPSFLDSSPSAVTTANSTKPSGPTPLFPVDVNEILNAAAKERTDGGPGPSGPSGPSGPQEVKSSKAPSVQQRSQLEELRKFGKEFRLQPSSSPSVSPASADPPADSSSSPAPPKPSLTSSAQDLPPTTEAAATPAAPTPTAPAGPQSSGPEGPAGATTAAPGSEEGCSESSDRSEAAVVQVKNSTLNPNAKEFLPIKVNAAVKPAPTPTPPRPTPPSPSVVLPPQPGGGGGALYSNPPGHYLSYVSPLHIQGPSIQAPQMYQYSMSTVNQGKYPRPKGPVVGQRPEHHPSPASPMISAAASAAGPPLVASPYPQSYLQYGQVIQAMPAHYHGQAVYSMLQGGARMLTSGAPHQQMGHPGQYPGQAEGQPGPQQAVYAQSFQHHSGSIHHPQPSTTPTGSQPPPQHTAPSPGHNQSSPAAPQPQSMFHSGGLSAPTPPNLQPGHSSPQASYTMQGYGLPGHQALPHGFPSISQLSQAHVPGGMSGPHHSAGHGLPPVMLHYVSPQQGSGSNPQQGAPQHFYIGPPQAVQVQAHPTQQLSFHPSAN